MTGRKRALGRGLESLLPASEDRSGGMQPTLVEIGLIDPNPFQPRRSWNSEDLRALADSIREQGILQPLVLRPAGGRFQIIAGERRLRAASLAGLQEVPAVLREAGDSQMLALALVENLQRADLGPIEKGEAFRRLSSEFGLTQEEMGKQVGLSRSAVANFIRLLDLPGPVKELLGDGRLSMGHGRALLGAGSPREAETLARKAVRRDMSVRQLEDAVRALQDGANSRKRRKPRPGTPLPDEEKLLTRLQRALKTRVRIRDRSGSGRIEIDYHSFEELDRILEILLRE